MKSFSKPQHAIASLTVLCGLVVLVYYGVLNPLEQLYEARERDLVELAERVRKFQHAAAEKPSLEAKLLALRNDPQRAQYFLSGSSPALAAANLQTWVRDLVESNAGRFVSAQPLSAEAQDDSSLIAISVRFRIKIELAGLQRVLHRVEFGDQNVFIDELIVLKTAKRRPTNGDQSPDVLDVQFKVIGQMERRDA